MIEKRWFNSRENTEDHERNDEKLNLKKKTFLIISLNRYLILKPQTCHHPQLLPCRVVSSNMYFPFPFETLGHPCEHVGDLGIASQQTCPLCKTNTRMSFKNCKDIKICLSFHVSINERWLFYFMLSSN